MVLYLRIGSWLDHEEVFTQPVDRSCLLGGVAFVSCETLPASCARSRSSFATCGFPPAKRLLLVIMSVLLC